jgi:cobyric acid synthase
MHPVLLKPETDVQTTDIVNMRVAQASAAATLIICDIRGAKDDASRQVHDAN